MGKTCKEKDGDYLSSFLVSLESTNSLKAKRRILNRLYGDGFEDGYNEGTADSKKDKTD